MTPATSSYDDGPDESDIVSGGKRKRQNKSGTRGDRGKKVNYGPCTRRTNPLFLSGRRGNVRRC